MVNYKFNFKKICLLIGPEGDFSNEEIEKVITLGHTAISLGDQRYRTETAGVLGCHLLHVQQQQHMRTEPWTDQQIINLWHFKVDFK